MVLSICSVYVQRLFDWKSRTGSRTRILKLLWKPKNAKHGKSNFIQSAVKAWNVYKLGKQLFKNYKDFKDWITLEVKRLNGNRNIT